MLLDLTISTFSITNVITTNFNIRCNYFFQWRIYKTFLFILDFLQTSSPNTFCLTLYILTFINMAKEFQPQKVLKDALCDISIRIEVCPRTQGNAGGRNFSSGMQSEIHVAVTFFPKF